MTEQRGHLDIGIDTDLNGNIRLEFGTPVTWLAMPPQQALEFGQLLERVALAVLRQRH